VTGPTGAAPDLVGAAVACRVRRGVREISLRTLITGEIASETRGGQNRDGVGRDAILNELRGIPGVTEHIVRQQPPSEPPGGPPGRPFASPAPEQRLDPRCGPLARLGAASAYQALDVYPPGGALVLARDGSRLRNRLFGANAERRLRRAVDLNRPLARRTTATVVLPRAGPAAK
jgi:hypothetical protein